jgi:hypothetical protein
VNRTVPHVTLLIALGVVTSFVDGDRGSSPEDREGWTLGECPSSCVARTLKNELGPAVNGRESFCRPATTITTSEEEEDEEDDTGRYADAHRRPSTPHDAHDAQDDGGDSGDDYVVVVVRVRASWDGRTTVSLAAVLDPPVTDDAELV